MALLEEMVGEGAEFKLIIEHSLPKYRQALNQTINDYVSPVHAFPFALAHETNANVFKFFRAYRPLSLKTEVFEFALQSEETAKIYGAMLGFAISKLTTENLTKEELNFYFRVCEKAVLLRSKKDGIELIGKTVVALRDIEEKKAISAEEIQRLKNSLSSANSVESVALVYREIEKVNRIVNPRTVATELNRWHYSPQLA